MSFKETIEKERRDLQSVKRPYETVAFLVFALLFVQNLFFVVVQLLDATKNKWFNVGNMVTRMNNSAFIARISGVFNNWTIEMILAILLFALYWFLIWFFVWNYCKKNNLAKWTWTLFVVYGPGVFLATPIVFFVIYVFRPYFARFFKRFVEEFKSYDPNKPFPEEKAEVFNEGDYDQYIEDEAYSEEPEEVEQKE